MCAASETVCNGATCADTMTDELNCGGCNAQCAPTQTCVSGSCLPTNVTCNRVREIDQTAGDGAYLNPQTNMYVYCDFTNNMTYLQFGVGPYTTAYPGFTWMSSDDFNDPNVRKAFIGLYNAERGVPTLSPGFTVGNCCIKASNAGLNQMLAFANNYAYPAHVATDSFNCTGPYSDSRYRIFIQQANEYSPVPLPDDYFDTHTASVASVCNDSGNPAFFMSRKAGLD